MNAYAILADHKAESRVPIIFVTVHDDVTKQRAAIEAGAVDFFRKPFDASAFVASVETAVRDQRGAAKLHRKFSADGGAESYT